MEDSVLITPAVEHRQKRDNHAQNLRILWLSQTRCRLCWDYPENGPPSLYRLIHVAVSISDGQVSVTYRSFSIPGSQTCIDLTDIDRNDMNIFLLNAIYTSSFHSALFIDCKEFVTLINITMNSFTDL